MKYRILPLLLAASMCGHLSIAKGNDRDGSGFFGVSDGRVQLSGRQNDSFYQDKERGWFWYEEPPIVEIDDPEPREPSPQPPPEKQEEPTLAKPSGPKPLSAEWFRKNMETYRDKAIDDPTHENVSTYMYLQRVMLDKAERFAEVSQRVVMADPLLDENSRRPIASFGAFAKDEMSTRGTEKVAKKLAEDAGLWFFYDSTCEFCVKQAGVLKGLINAYGFKVLAIARDGLPLPGGSFPDFTIDRGQAKKLGVETTPALFLVRPGENGGAIQLGQGLLAGDEIIKRSIARAHETGWLNDEEYQETRIVNPIQVETKTIQSIDENSLKNPTKWIETIRMNLKKQL